MKELIDFIDKDICPCCGNKTHLYIKMLYSDLFKMDPDTGIFNPVSSKDKKSCMVMFNSSFKLNKEIYEKNKNADMYFFRICNESAIESKDDSDFELNVHDLCYYKSTKFLKFRETDGRIFFNISEDIEESDGIISFEAYSFTLDTDTEHKSYMMRIDNILQKTSIWHYTCSQEDLNNEDYDPKIFHKEIDAIKKNINFSDKEKVINMISNWILIS